MATQPSLGCRAQVFSKVIKEGNMQGASLKEHPKQTNVAGLHLLSLHDCTNLEKKIFEKKFREVIEPVYGNQDSFIHKIFSANDRTTMLLFDHGNFVGAIVYKTKKSDEYTKYDISQGIEIKTFFTHAKNKTKKGLYASLLFREVATEALNSGAKCLFGTVSERKAMHLSFFKNLGFVEATLFPDLYEPGKYETLICHKHPFSLWVRLDDIIEKCMHKIKGNSKKNGR